MTNTRRTFIARTGTAITCGITAIAGCLGSSDSSEQSQTSDGNESEQDANGGSTDDTDEESSEPVEADISGSINNELEDGLEVLDHTLYRGDGRMGVEIVVKVIDHSQILGPFQVGATAFDSDDAELDNSLTMVSDYETGDKYRERVGLSNASPDETARYTVDIEE